MFIDDQCLIMYVIIVREYFYELKETWLGPSNYVFYFKLQI